MRKLVLVVAVLALAGCGEGKRVDVHKPQSAVSTATVTAPSQQWDLEVKGEITQAVSDLSGWLIEHSFVANVIKDNGTTRILMGPFNSKAEAEAKQAEVAAALTRAKKQNIQLLVVEHTVTQ